MGIGYKRQWKCLYCNRVWKSVTSFLGKQCPDCGSTQIRATMAKPGPVSPRRTQDRKLNLGQDLLMEAQR